MVADSTQSDIPEKSTRKRKKVVEKKKVKKKKVTGKKVLYPLHARIQRWGGPDPP